MLEILKEVGKPRQIEIGKVGEVGSRAVLLEDGVVEDLVRQGRVPLVVEALTFPDEICDVYVPPQGVSFGDKYLEVPRRGLEFFVAGESKGFTELFVVPRLEGEQVFRRSKKTLKAIGRLEGSENSPKHALDFYERQNKSTSTPEGPDEDQQLRVIFNSPANAEEEQMVLDYQREVKDLELKLRDELGE